MTEINPQINAILSDNMNSRLSTALVSGLGSQLTEYADNIAKGAYSQGHSAGVQAGIDASKQGHTVLLGDANAYIVKLRKQLEDAGIEPLPMEGTAPVGVAKDIEDVEVRDIA